MKYCGECGAQLKDDDLFCGECGAEQEIFAPMTQKQTNSTNNTALPMSNPIPTGPVSDKNVTPKKGIPLFAIIIFLVLCSPLLLALLLSGLLLILPEFLWWCIYLGLQIVALAIMWRQKNWHIGIKIGVLALYILSYLV